MSRLALLVKGVETFVQLANTLGRALRDHGRSFERPVIPSETTDDAHPSVLLDHVGDGPVRDYLKPDTVMFEDESVRVPARDPLDPADAATNVHVICLVVPRGDLESDGEDDGSSQHELRDRIGDLTELHVPGNRQRGRGIPLDADRLARSSEAAAARGGRGCSLM